MVTGAGGFVGGHAAVRLAAEGVRVRAFVRNPSKKTVVNLSHPNIRIEVGDLLDVESCRRAARSTQVVIHAAIDRAKQASQVRSVIIEGTRNLYEAARDAGVARFLYLSSLSVYYGIISRLEQYADRDDCAIPLVPSGDLYGDAKIESERFLLQQSGLPLVTTFRAPAIIGPGSPRWSVQVLRDARKGRLIVPGAGNFSTSFVYIDNLVDCLLAAIHAPNPAPVYHVIDGHVTYRQLLEPAVDVSGRSPKSIPLWCVTLFAHFLALYSRCTGRWQRNSLAMIRAIHCESRPLLTAAKARRELGWNSQVTFEEAVRRTTEWMQRAEVH